MTGHVPEQSSHNLTLELIKMLRVKNVSNNQKQVKDDGSQSVFMQNNTLTIT